MTKSELIETIAARQSQLSSKDVELAVKTILEHQYPVQQAMFMHNDTRILSQGWNFDESDIYKQARLRLWDLCHRPVDREG